MVTEKSVTQKMPSPFGRDVKFRFIGGKSSGQEITVTKETFFIGRSGNNNLVLDDRSVSRKHAVLNFIDGHFILSDLNSFKGIRINGQKIHEVEIKNGDRIKMGEVLLEFIDGKRITIKRSRGWLIWPIFIITVILVVALFFFTSKKDVPQVGDDMLREIEYNYSQGIKALNASKDVGSARSYWKKAVELDPEGKTPQGRKASVLLKNLPSNTGGAADR